MSFNRAVIDPKHIFIDLTQVITASLIVVAVERECRESWPIAKIDLTELFVGTIILIYLVFILIIVVI